MPLDFLKTAFVTLLVMLDPPGLAPVFIGLTLGMSGVARRGVALRATFIALAILAAVTLGGRTVLEALGITFDMLFALRGERKPRSQATR